MELKLGNFGLKIDPLGIVGGLTICALACMGISSALDSAVDCDGIFESIPLDEWELNIH